MLQLTIRIIYANTQAFSITVSIFNPNNKQIRNNTYFPGEKFVQKYVSGRI